MKKKLPHRNIPKLSDVLKEKGADRVLEKDGRLKTHGPHVDENPVYWVNRPDGTPEKRIYKKPAGRAGTGAPMVLKFSPPLPSDIGNTHDASSSLLFCANTEPNEIRADCVNQGQVPDCWFIAPLASIAVERPELRAALVKKENGKFVITMRDFNKNTVEITVDGMLGDSQNRPSPSTGEIWACLVEKAEAFGRYYIDGVTPVPNTFASVGWGFPGEAFNHLGFDYTSISLFDPNIATAVRAGLARKDCMAICTGQTDGSLVSSHCYFVYDCKPDGTMTLGNPWNFDASGNDGVDDGFVTVSLGTVRNNCSSICITTNTPAVPTPKPALLGDGNGDGIVDLADFDIWFRNVGRINANGPSEGDFNSDGIVDALDFDIWFKNVGKTNPSPAGDEQIKSQALLILLKSLKSKMKQIIQLCE